MEKKSSKSKIKPQTGNFVIVTFAEDMEQAREYEALLKNDDIPVEIHENTENIESSKSLILMVPDEYLDEAHVIIESQNAYDDFYEFAMDDDDENLGVEFFDEDF